MSNTIYECTNPNCALGSQFDHGKFTDGISARQKTMLTGQPEESLKEGVDFGEGVCPTCGEVGEPTDVQQTPVEGTDPHADLHAKAAESIAPAMEELRAKLEAGEITQEELLGEVAVLSEEAQTQITEAAEGSSDE